MKKLLTIIILIICILSMQGCNKSIDDLLEKSNKITGHYLLCKNDIHMIIIADGSPNDGSPIQMDNRSGNEALFDGLQTGDKIKITCGPVRESYPGGTDVYKCILIEKGSFQNIPQNVYDSLKELGWVD